jgi:hypothetical protein
MPMKTDKRPSHKTDAQTLALSPQPGSYEALVEETLDPDDWDELRVLGHRMLDDMMDYLSSVRERPVWRPVPADLKQKLSLSRFG